MRVAFVGVLRGVAVAQIMYFQCTTSGTPSQADLDAWLVTLSNAYKTRFQPVLVTDYAFNYAKAVMFTPGGTEIVSVHTPATWNGTGASASLSGENCIVISWQTNVYWRGGKPRSYFPVRGSDVTSGTDLIAAGSRTTWATAAANFNTDANAITQGAITGTQHGFVSFRSGNAERGTPLFFAVTGAVIHPRLGSQRRRLGKWQN